MNTNQAFETLAAEFEKSFIFANNPALSENFGFQQRLHILGQYIWLTLEIREYLAMMIAKMDNYPEVKGELKRNLGQELGEGMPDGVPHHEFLLDALAPYVQGICLPEKSKATAQFLARVRASLNNVNFWYALGAMYELELTAIPELKVVGKLINLLCGREAVGVKAPESKLNFFFQSHIGDWEVGHESELREAISLNRLDGEQFEVGGSEVLSAMENWWTRLAIEAEEIG